MHVYKVFMCMLDSAVHLLLFFFSRRCRRTNNAHLWVVQYGRKSSFVGIGAAFQRHVVLSTMSLAVADRKLFMLRRLRFENSFGKILGSGTPAWLKSWRTLCLILMGNKPFSHDLCCCAVLYSDQEHWLGFLVLAIFLGSVSSVLLPAHCCVGAELV